MNHAFLSKLSSVLVSAAFVAAASAGAQKVQSVTTFASGSAVHGTSPDSIALTQHSVWVAYTNGADSTGASGSSTVVRYSMNGAVRHTYTIAGYVDGLKVDPRTGDVWVLQNQDGNSTVTIIEPKEAEVSGPIQYAMPSSARGYDEVAFRGNQAFLSYTNPAGPSDPTIQLVKNGSNPIVVKPVLYQGATGTNLATGQQNQPTTQNDPDSLKITPYGDLMLSSAADGQLIFVSAPATTKQSVSFLTLLDPATGQAVSELDDAVFATSEKGIFYLADTKNNRILKIKVREVRPGSLFASVGSLNELGLVNQHTGVVQPVVSGLSAPHGLAYVPQSEDEDENE